MKKGRRKSNMENDSSPYQRRRILLRLHVCKLKQRNYLWYRNTSFFSIKRKKKRNQYLICAFLKKVISVIAVGAFELLL